MAWEFLSCGERGWMDGLVQSCQEFSWLGASLNSRQLSDCQIRDDRARRGGGGGAGMKEKFYADGDNVGIVLCGHGVREDIVIQVISSYRLTGKAHKHRDYILIGGLSFYRPASLPITTRMWDIRRFIDGESFGGGGENLVLTKLQDKVNIIKA